MPRNASGVAGSLGTGDQLAFAPQLIKAAIDP